MQNHNTSKKLKKILVLLASVSVGIALFGCACKCDMEEVKALISSEMAKYPVNPSAKSSKNTPKVARKYKYFPKTKKELMILVRKPSVNLGEINTSKITDMSSLFAIQGLKGDDVLASRDYSGIELWDTSNVENMSFMFQGAKTFNQDISDWNVSNVERMHAMFHNASVFNKPLDKWNVSNVEVMTFMFAGAKAFNQPLNSWNVENVEDMTSMFAGAKNFNQPLNKWDISGIESMGSMFSDAESFQQDLEAWGGKLDKGVDVDDMFEGSGLESKPPKWYKKRARR